jgi:outer membrane lipoprotein-sorting protein
MKKILLLIFLFSSFKTFAQPDKSKEIFRKMMAAMDGVKTCSFVLDLHERIKGELKHDQYVVKLNSIPYKAYIFSITPNPGAEALLKKGENNDKVIVNPDRFPIPTLNLSPYHNILRRNHQYTLWEMGFNYITNVLNGYMKKYGDSLYSYLRLDPDVIWNGKSYYQIVIEKKDFAWENYTVKAGETITTISNRLLVNDYMVLENNPDVKHFENLKTGQVIKVPNAFGKKIIFYADKLNFLPLAQIIYDEKGFYGRVEISSIVINPHFTDEDFSRDNKKYGF